MKMAPVAISVVAIVIGELSGRMLFYSAVLSKTPW